MMIEKNVKILGTDPYQTIRDDLEFWLSKTPEERIAAVEYLRKQYHGSSARLQISVRVIQQTQS